MLTQDTLTRSVTKALKERVFPGCMLNRVRLGLIQQIDCSKINENFIQQLPTMFTFRDGKGSEVDFHKMSARSLWIRTLRKTITSNLMIMACKTNKGKQLRCKRAKQANKQNFDWERAG